MISDLLQDISPRIVHKDNENDVLICNNRPAIPSFLEPEVIGELKNDISDSSFKKLLSFYKFTGKNYVLNTMQQSISVQDFNDIANNLSNICLDDYYKKESGKFVLSNRWVPELLEIIFSKYFDLEEYKITGSQRREISNILNDSKKIELLTDEYFTLFNDTTNYFFYSKDHEHVPGLMMIEAARQSMYVHFYNNSGHKRGEVTISILDLKCEFPDYTEACYNVEIVVKDLELDRKEKCKNGVKVAQFFQKNILVAEVTLKYVVIPMPIFNRMRNIKISQNHWFNSLKNLKKEILLICDNNLQLQAEIKLISINEIKLIITNDLSKHDISKIKIENCIINVAGHGLICMNVDNEKNFISSGEDEAVIRFIPVDRKQRDLITKIIKDYCHFVEEKSYCSISDEKHGQLKVNHV